MPLPLPAQLLAAPAPRRSARVAPPRRRRSWVGLIAALAALKDGPMKALDLEPPPMAASDSAQAAKHKLRTTVLINLASILEKWAITLLLRMSTLPCAESGRRRHRPRPGPLLPLAHLCAPRMHCSRATSLQVQRHRSLAPHQCHSPTSASAAAATSPPPAADAMSKFCPLCTPGWAPPSRPPLHSWATSRSAGRSCRPCPARWAAWQVRRSSGNSGASGSGLRCCTIRLQRFA